MYWSPHTVEHCHVAFAAACSCQTGLNINLYADDFHVSDTFRSPAQFERCVARLGILLDLIESQGLVINLTKT